jgi:hypothetical protein
MIFELTPNRRCSSNTALDGLPSSRTVRAPERPELVAPRAYDMYAEKQHQMML